MMMGAVAGAATFSVAASALFAAGEGALQAYNAGGSTAGRSEAGLLQHRERALRALAIARLVSNVIAGIAIAFAFRIVVWPAAWLVAAGTLSVILIALIGNAVPRAIGESRSVAVVRALAPILSAVDALLRPLVSLEFRLESRSRAMPVTPGGLSSDTATEQFRQVVTASADVSRDERDILHGVFSLGGTEVQEIMVPRIAIVALDGLAPWSQVLDRVRSAEHARLPVYDGNIDEITGILSAKDLLPAVIEGRSPKGGWLSLVRPAVFIPEGKRIDALLREFKATGTHMAIVVDEYGGTAGLVTLEDILEEIVGEIRDEHDLEELPIETEDGVKFWVSGRVTLEDLSEAIGQRIDHEDVATVGGLIFTLLGRVPRAGEELMLQDFRVVVERVVQRRIERVYFERVATSRERIA